MSQSRQRGSVGPDASSERAVAITPPEPMPAEFVSQYPLDRSYTFLNHGSFGSCPKPVHAFQRHWQDVIESKPIEMLGRKSNEMLYQAKSTVGPFLGMTPVNFAFVTNATDAANAILRSLTFEPGDELLTTTHVYNAIRKTMHCVGDRSGAKTVETPIDLPMSGPRDVLEAIEGAMTTRTKLLVIDHVTSPTATVFPARELVALCKSRGVKILLDGAHAPGMLDLDIESLGATYYIGNLHKWTCAPKGAGFIWVHPDHQQGIHPSVISHHYGEGYFEEFSWQGTRDFSPWLASAEAIRYLGTFGWPRIRQHNRQLATWAQQLLCGMWSVPSASPLDGSMIGSMVTVLLPGQALVQSLGTFDKLGAILYDQYRIEVPIIDWGGRWWVRVSCQVYNTPTDYEKLGNAVLKIVHGIKRR